jgi:putative transposase
VPKYRLRILDGQVGRAVNNCIRSFSEQSKCEIIELNVQPDHVHLLVNVPPKLSISKFVGMIKGRTAIRVFNQFRNLKQKPYWGNHFWAQGFCVDTVGLYSDMIQKYVKYQEKKKNILNWARKSHFEKVTFFFTTFGGKAFYPLLGVISKPRPLGVVVY